MERSVSIGAWLLALLRRAGGWLRTPSGRRAQWLLSLAVSIVLTVILFRTVSRIGWQVVLAGVPGHPMVYILFYLAYFTPVCVDWYFYRRWWGVGPRAFGVFLKKRVMNEAFVSYSGDTYLLVWASAAQGMRVDPKAPPRLLGRSRAGGADPAANPLAAVKDVALMSGLAGNSLTLLMLGLAVALGGGSLLEKVSATGLARNFAIGFAILVAFNVGLVLFRQRVLSLPPRENLFVLRLHFARLVLAYGLVTLSWMVAAPDIPLRSWVYLGAMRMVLARMPVPNKEILFASVAAAATGPSAPEVAALMAMQGVMHLAGHALSWGIATALEDGGRAASRDNR